MSNADILFGAVVLLGYCLILAPMIGSKMSSSVTYKEALLLGNFLTILVVLFAVLASALTVAVMYFTIGVNQGSPMTQFIEWVNAL